MRSLDESRYLVHAHRAPSADPFQEHDGKSQEGTPKALTVSRSRSDWMVVTVPAGLDFVQSVGRWALALAAGTRK